MGVGAGEAELRLSFKGEASVPFNVWNPPASREGISNVQPLVTGAPAGAPGLFYSYVKIGQK